MNTQLDIVLWGVHQELALIVSGKIFKRIRDLQKVLDRFDSGAETFQANQKAFSETLIISPFLMQTIKKGIQYFHRSQGYFNVFAGKAYSSLKETNNHSLLSLPKNLPEEMIEIDESQNSIRFLSQYVSLDFGGIGKGLALDEASKILEEDGIENAFISFGGSSVLTRGHHPHGEYWPFTFQEEKVDQEVWPLRNDAISVSSLRQGTGKKAHILNPKSGLPLDNRTTFVQSESATEAEVLSTALIAAPSEKHQKIVNHFNVKKWAVFDIQ